MAADIGTRALKSHKLKKEAYLFNLLPLYDSDQSNNDIHKIYFVLFFRFSNFSRFLLDFCCQQQS